MAQRIEQIHLSLKYRHKQTRDFSVVPQPFISYSSLGLFVFTGTTSCNSNSSKKKQEELYIHSCWSCLTHDRIGPFSNRWKLEIVAGLISSLSKDVETFLADVTELWGRTAGRVSRCAVPSIDDTHLVLYFWLRPERYKTLKLKAKGHYIFVWMQKIQSSGVIDVFGSQRVHVKLPKSPNRHGWLPAHMSISQDAAYFTQ